MKKIKGVVSLVMTVVLAVGSGIMIGRTRFAPERVVCAASQQPSNPLYDEDTDTTSWSYVYFGEYPQSEVSGEALTDKIKNAAYDGKGDAVVDGELPAYILLRK